MKNWKTTLIGTIAAGLFALQPIVDNGEISLMQLFQAFGIAALGFLASDLKNKNKD